MCPIVPTCILLDENVSNLIQLFQNVFKFRSIPIQMYPIASKYIQNINLTFKAPNKDKTIDYTIEN